MPVQPKRTIKKPTPPKKKIDIIAPKTKVQPKIIQALVGKWKGEKASDFTRFVDIKFNADGTGTRDGQQFTWEANGQKNISVRWLRRLTQAEYNDIRGKADVMQKVSETIVVFTTGRINHKVAVNGGQYSLVDKEEEFIISNLSATNLSLTMQNSKGEIRTTKHFK